MTVTITDQQARNSDTDDQVQNLARDLHSLGVRFDSLYTNSPATLEETILRCDSRRTKNILIIGNETTFESVLKVYRRRPIESAIALISDSTSPSASYANTTYSANLGLSISQRKTVYQSVGMIDDLHCRIAPIVLHSHTGESSIRISPCYFEEANCEPGIQVSNGGKEAHVLEFGFTSIDPKYPNLGYKKITIAPFIMRLIVGARRS